MNTCQVRLGNDTEELCNNPATYQVTAGCVHEHLKTLNLCAEDWESYKFTQKVGTVYCWPCEQAGLWERVTFVEVKELENSK